MAKTETTLLIEKLLYKEFSKQGIFPCFEVTIGWYGKERVDFMTFDTNDIFRCFEIKVSKSDFYSNAYTTFCGHYNYYVMPDTLYSEVEKDIPKNVGVYLLKNNLLCLIKKAKKTSLTVDKEILKNSMIRSLSRDTTKYYSNLDEMKYTSLKSEFNAVKKENKNLKQDYNRLLLFLYEKLGFTFGKELTEIFKRKHIDREISKHEMTRFRKGNELSKKYKDNEISTKKFEDEISNYNFGFKY